MNEKKTSKLDLLFADSIMTEAVHVIKRNMTIGQVSHLMLRERVSGYPVVDEDGAVVGIVTMTDLFKLIDKMLKREDGLGLDEMKKNNFEEAIKIVKDKPVTALMSKDVKFLTPETPVTQIIEAVVEKNIHTFPVIKDGKLAGIIGRRDVLNAVFVYG